jgi:lysozyme
MNGISHDLVLKLRSKLKKEEGLRLKPYKCTKGFTTIGIGRNLDTNGLSEHEANYLFENDLSNIFVDLNRNLPDWKFHALNVQIVLCDMCFNLGIKKLLKFKKFLEAIEDCEYELAIEEIKDSLYYQQVKNRANRNISLIEDLL